MKRNVLTILAITGTFSVCYLLYKWKRRFIKISNLKKTGSTSDMNNIEKENIIYQVFVNDQSHSSTEIESGEDNFYSDIHKNSTSESTINLELNFMNDTVPALFSFDFEGNENSESTEACNNLSELDMAKILKSTTFCDSNENTEFITSINCKNTQKSINSLLSEANMKFLEISEDGTNVTFLNPSTISTELVNEMDNNVTEILKPQNGEFIESSFNELNLKDLNSNVNTKIMNGCSNHIIENSIEDNSLCKLNDNFSDKHQEMLSPTLDNDVEFGASSVLSAEELNGENHLSTLNSCTEANGIENSDSLHACNFEENSNIPRTLNEPNLDEKQELPSVKRKKQKRRRKKKNNQYSSLEDANSNNGNLNIELPKSEIVNECYTDSSCNPLDTATLENNNGSTGFDKLSTPESAAPNDLNSAACCDAGPAFNDLHYGRNTSSSSSPESSYDFPPSLEPYRLAEDSHQSSSNLDSIDQCFEMTRKEVYTYQFDIKKSLAGKLIGKNGLYHKSLQEECSVNISVVNHESNEDLSVCRMKGPTSEAIQSSLTKIRKRFPLKQYPDLTLKDTSILMKFDENVLPPEFIQPTSSYQPPCPPLSIVENMVTIPVGIVFTVHVSYVDSLTMLWIQQPRSPSFEKFVQMTIGMEEIYGDGLLIPTMPMPLAKNITAVCKLRGIWSRCVTLSSVNSADDNICIRMLDTGGSFYVAAKYLRQVHVSLCDLPLQANLIRLYGLDPPEGQSEYSEKGLDRLIDLLKKSEELIATVGAHTQFGDPLIKLYRKSRSQGFPYINKILVDEGYARWADYVTIRK